MSKRLPWFRMYADFLNDPKLIALAFEDQRHFIGILALKCDGAIDDVADGDLLDRIVAQRLWIDHAIIRDVKKRLVNAGLIDSRWQPAAWDRRQMRSDADATGAERQRRFRESKKSNALHNGAVTRLDTDTDTDTELDTEKENKDSSGASFSRSEVTSKASAKKKQAASTFILPDWISREHWDAWHSCKKRKGATDEQKELAVKKLDAWRKQGIDHAAALENAAIGGWQGLFKPFGPMKTGLRHPAPDDFGARQYTSGRI